MLNQDENRRYYRHFQLGEIGLEGQLKLKKAKVLVVGAGGLGCPALIYLTAMGVGEIGILDFDKVAHSNLQRQFLYTTGDIGENKVEIAIKKLKQQNPSVIFHAHQLKLDENNAETVFSKYDFILDATDSISIRYIINDSCVKLGKTFVYGSIHKFEGQVSVFNYESGPTYRCLFPENVEKQEVLNCIEAGVVGVIPGIIGTIQATEILKLILGIGEILSGKLLVINLLTCSFNLIEFSKKVKK
jgi:sulfur-carrier protein adenylyltransferase/sulfurtransferase